jgi:putative Mg2+ transporter-C (MgtC) family protein
VSAYAFPGPISDPTRIAAQIVTGVGFLGGGAILHYRGSVRGLTTAASLWAVAAIGMAAGAGLYVIAVGGAVLVVTTLYVLDRLEAWVRRRWGRANQSNVDEQPDGRTEDMP